MCGQIKGRGLCGLEALGLKQEASCGLSLLTTASCPGVPAASVSEQRLSVDAVLTLTLLRKSLAKTSSSLPSQYPVEIRKYEYDPNFAIRGLHYDVQRVGIILMFFYSLAHQE